MTILERAKEIADLYGLIETIDSEVVRKQASGRKVDLSNLRRKRRNAMDRLKRRMRGVA